MYDSIKRDTACFSPRQWFIEGYEGPMFSTKEDAEQAIRFAYDHEMRMREELRKDVQEAIDRILY